MRTEETKKIGWTRFYLNLYDVLGYFAPGFIFIIGFIVITVYFGVFNVNLKSTYESIAEWHGILGWYIAIGMLIFSYVLGNIFSWVSKLFERFKFFGTSAIPKQLFTGSETPKIQLRRKASKILLERFSLKYHTYFLTKLYPNQKGPYKDFLVELIEKRGELRYSDLIWDADFYLLNYAPSQYYSTYSFLALSGFFRTLTIASVSLLLYLVYVRAFLESCDFSWFVLIVPIGFCVFSYFRYLKFERMFNYQVIRSFALF